MRGFFIAVLILLGLNSYEATGLDTNLPDSMLTLEYVSSLTLDETDRAQFLLDEIRRRGHGFEPHRLDYQQAMIYFNSRKYRLAAHYFEQLSHDEEIKKTPEHITVMFFLAECYSELNNHPKAMSVAVEGVEIAKAQGDKSQLGELYIFMGVETFNQKDERLAQEYFDLAEKVLQEAGDTFQLYWLNIMIADRWIDHGKYEGVEKYIDRAQLYLTEYNNYIQASGEDDEIASFHIAQFSSFAAWAYELLGQSSKAREYYDSFKASYLADICPHNGLIIAYLLEIEDTNEIIPISLQCLSYFEEHGDTLSNNIASVYEYLRSGYEFIGKYDSALYYAKQELLLYETLREKELEDTAIEIATIYSVQEKEARIHAAQVRIRLITGAAIACLILLMLISYLYRRTNTAYKLLAVKAREWAEDIVLEITPPAESRNAEHNQPVEPSERDREIMTAVNEQMTLHHAYRDPDLTAETLAHRLGLHRNALSRAVNSINGKNFNRYINEFRIKEAIRILSSDKERDPVMDEICERTGYSNRTSFYRAFKQITGLSPSEFRKNSRHVKK